MRYLKIDVHEPLTCVSCGQFLSPGGWTHATRTIESYEVIYGIRGRAYIQQEGQPFEVAPGKALLLLPGRTHGGYRPSEGEVSFYWMHFSCRKADLLDDAEAGPYFVAAQYAKRSENIVLPLFSEPAEGDKLAILIRQLLHCTESAGYRAITADYFITLVLMEIARQEILLRLHEPEDGAGRRAAEILEWVRAKVAEGGTAAPAEVADHFGLNRDYLCRMLKKNAGVTLRQYVNDVRIRKARELLVQTDLSIKETAYAVGMDDERYFMRLFKKSEGISPSQYRNSFYRTRLNGR